jgi:hypothetical protein
MIRLFLAIILHISAAAFAGPIIPGSVTLGNVQYTLSTDGVLLVSSPKFSKPLRIESESHLARLIPVAGRMFVEDTFERAYYVMLPEAKSSFFNRQLVQMLNSDNWVNVFRGKWTDPYHWDLVSLHGRMMIHGEGRHIATHVVIERESGADIILVTLENKFSLKKLLEELDASQSGNHPACVKILLGLQP